MIRCVLVGQTVPLQKVLYKIKSHPNIQVLGIYTDIGKSNEIEKQVTTLKLPLYDINILKSSKGIQILKKQHPDWIFNINSTLLFTSDLLSIPTHGSINVHPGLLPEYAGLHTHQWAIRNGEKKAGVTLHWMDLKLDAGPIIYQKSYKILSTDTGLSMYLKYIRTAVELIERSLNEISKGKPLPSIKQNISNRRIYLHKDALNGKINWKMTSKQIYNFVRAADYGPFKSPTYTPYFLLNGKPIYVKKTEVYYSTFNKPGNILSVIPNGLVISTLDKSILVIKIIFNDMVITNGFIMGEKLGLKKGDSLL